MKKKLKTLWKLLIILLCIIAALLLLRLCIRAVIKIKAQNDNEISEIKAYTLNGEEQTVLLEGKKADLPVLVMLHGGPGFTPPFNEGCRGLFPEITSNYLTVYWDQLGCGKNKKKFENGSSLPDNITRDDYVLMTRDLLVNLRKDYPDRPVYLFGISWGSYLTARIASEYPELIDGVLVNGQLCRYMFQTEDVIDGILEFCDNAEEIAFLEECKSKEKLSNEEIFHIENSILKYTDGFLYRGKSGPRQSSTYVIKLIFRYCLSPDYSLKNVFGVLKDTAAYRPLALDMLHDDISESIQNIKVPYYILQGENDLQTSRYQIEELVNRTNNPNITLQIVLNCGHIPTSNCFQKILEQLPNLYRNGD